MSFEESTLYITLRVFLGIVFVYHGYRKITNIEPWINSMNNNSIPSIISVPAAWAEFIIGLLLIFGLLTRWAALGSVIFMIAAIRIAHIQDPIYTYLYQISLLVIALLLACTGGGLWSIDSLLKLN